MFIKEMEEVLPQLEALYENDKPDLILLTLWPWRENCWLRSLE